MTFFPDRVFAGRCTAILIDPSGEFVLHRGDDPEVTTWLAGSYSEPVAPARLCAGQAASLFGQFALLRHDARTRTLTVLTDRYGHFPLYMARHEGRVCLSADYPALARHCSASAAPDHGAMSDILAAGVPFNQSTPSRRITAFAGATEVTFDLDTLAERARKVWDPEALLAGADLSFDSVKDDLVDLFLEGVALATANVETVAITLSGGVDSRCLLAGALHLGKDTVAYSTGVPGSRALTYAAAMADACGVKRSLHPLGEAFVARLPSLMRQANEVMHGMSFSSEVEAMWLRQHVATDGVLLHGAFGELYKIGEMHLYPYDAQVARLRGAAVADRLWQRFDKVYTQRSQCFAPSYREALGQQARQHLADKVAYHQRGLDTAGVLQMLYIEEFLGKVVKSSWQMWRQRTRTMFPFGYPPLVDLVLRVRAGDKTDNRFAIHLLKRLNKTLASYPDSNTGVRIGASRFQRELMHVFDYASKRLLPHKRGFEHQDFARWLSETPAGLERMFDDFHAATDALHMPHIRQLIRQCRAGEDLASRTLSFVWAWSLWKTDGRRAGLAPQGAAASLCDEDEERAAA